MFGSRTIGILFSLSTTWASVIVAQESGNGVQINTDLNGFNIIGDAANEPTIALSPINPNVMVVGWRQFPTISYSFRKAGYAYTRDGGQTWINGGVLDDPPGAEGSIQSDPVLTVDRSGSFFYNSLVLEAPEIGQAVYRSDTGGRTWHVAVFIYPGPSDKNWYGIDHRTEGLGAGNHYAIWDRGGRFARSTDEGASWTTWRFLNADSYSYVETDSTGTVHVAFWKHDGVDYQQSVDAKDPDKTPTFSTPILVPMGDMPEHNPQNPGGAAGMITLEAAQAGEPNEGTLYMLCSAVPSGPDVCDVRFSKSVDGGLTWSSPKRVNDDSNPEDWQWMACMSLAPGGRIDAVWFDTRDDPDEHFLSRLYYSCSYDGGDTWIANRALSDQFDSTVGFPAEPKMGDYLQCVSDSGGTNIAYPATFNGEQDIYYLRHHPARLEVEPLVAGQHARFEVTDAWPNKRTWLAYSLDGPGRTRIPALNVVMNITHPRQVGSWKFADAGGNVSWTLWIPSNTSGFRVWMQAVQTANTSAVVSAEIQ